jgi:hypothetical protein
VVAFIGFSLFRVTGADCPPHDGSTTSAIRTFDFDRIAAIMRQCSIIHRTAGGAPENWAFGLPKSVQPFAGVRHPALKVLEHRWER